MAEATADPITVAIERRIEPSRAVEATSWMQAGTDLAATFPGFLGSGWVRASEGSDIWYMLYRFTDIATLESWEESPARNWWLDSGHAFAKEVRIERRTGIEGWFDAEGATGIETKFMPDATGPIVQPIPAAPPRWKQAVTIALAFFPMNLLFSWLLTLIPPLHDLALPLRLGLTTVVLIPLMTYFILPFVTRLLRPWLQRGI